MVFEKTVVVSIGSAARVINVRYKPDNTAISPCVAVDMLQTVWSTNIGHDRR